MKEEVVGEDMNEWRKIQLQVEKALCDYGAIRQTQIKKYRENGINNPAQTGGSTTIVHEIRAEAV